MEKSIVKLSNLEVAYKYFKLENVHFEIKKGINVLIGPNGSGKTTIIKSIMGGITNIGENAKIDILPDIKLAYIPEKNYFDKNVKVLKFLKLWFNFYNPNQKFYITDLIKNYPEIDISNLLKFPLGKLSSGQLRRVLIFKSLLNNPTLIIMDEPFINLDPDNIINFFKIIKRMQKNKITILIATHMLAEIEKYIDFVHIIFFGKMVYSNKYNYQKNVSLYSLYKKYSNDYGRNNDKTNFISTKK